MADLPVEEFQRRQVSQISQDIADQIDVHEQQSQTTRQHRWEIAHTHLVTLLRTLDQDYDEACTKAKRPLESFSDDDLVYLIHIRLREIQSKVTRKENPDEIFGVKRSLQELGQKYADLERVNATVTETCKKIQAENDRLAAHLSAVRQAQQTIEKKTGNEGNIVKKQSTSPDFLSGFPDWIHSWRSSRTFEKTSTAILIMGESGKALRPSIVKEMACRLSLFPENGSLDEAITRLFHKEENSHPILIEKMEVAPGPGSSSGGNFPDVLRLTEDGENAFQALTGLQTKENEYERLIRRHSSPEHTILNIQASEILSEAGYIIRAQAQEIQLSDGGAFIPDITAADPQSGEIIFVEVEHDGNKGQTARKQKWMNLYEASNGNLYVFCDNLSCQRAVQGEINLILGGLAYNSYLTNLNTLRNGKRSEGGGIWLSTRKMTR